jgi:hypothetical protein
LDISAREIFQEIFGNKENQKPPRKEDWLNSPLSDQQVSTAAYNAWKYEEGFNKLMRRAQEECGNERQFRFFVFNNCPLLNYK